ncbi:MAG: Dam family site-specific DNA-(adenine-N6)-methyltransferase [Sulfurospirillaceae bacterium]|nr:Dam family site-specific DNA-(adenine-N6)-methyltransferase [Sulfurospirillaceae bacterium]
MNTNLVPFLKWAGGKRWLTVNYANLFPEKFNNYIEPFVGGGAVYFNKNPKQAIISDMNTDLINTYKAIQEDWGKVEKLLIKYHTKHNRDFYYYMRSKKTKSIFTSAAKFIYLNRTCWNGLYRVNKKGEFNVPIGTKTNVILNSDNFQEISNRLKNTKILNLDFEQTIAMAKEDDFLFVDPPYTVKHDNNGFVKYNEVLFEWSDQERLHHILLEAKLRGVKIMLTNAHHQSIRELYEKDFHITTVERHSVIAGNANARGKSKEYLIQG